MTEDFLNAYGTFDRLLHRIAFATRMPQAALADLEDRIFSKKLAAIAPGPPVLITGLPRAGTTILLEMLAAMPEFASHVYRDMPFILCPMIWQRLSRRFQKPGAPRPRAHDDGIEVSPDSPEAFEEVIWMWCFRDHYRKDSIAPWTSCRNAELVELFASHRKKIIALRAAAKPAARRYVSKNNVTIARIPAIWEAVPDAIVVVPFRDPLQHAASLLRQHRRFTEMHKKDAFARRYMAGIGHFDFGATFKPIDFDGWLATATTRDATKLQFWLEYWIAAYRSLLRHRGRPRLFFVRDEAMTATADLSRLAAAIETADEGALLARRAILRPTRDHEVDLGSVSAASVASASALCEELGAASVV